MTERILYDEKGLPIIVDDGQGGLGQPRAGSGGSGRPDRDEPRSKRSGMNATKMFARRPLVGVKKVKPEEEELVLDETIPPVRKFGYAPQALLLTNEGSLYVANMRTEMQIGNAAIIGSVPANPITNPPPAPTPLADVIFMLESPFLSGVIKRVKLFAAWQAPASPALPICRSNTELTIYKEDPQPFILAGTPIPRNIIVYENFFLPIPVPFTASLTTFESVIDEDIDIPYELQFNKQSSGTLNSPNVGVIIPRLWFRLAQWTLSQRTVVYDWRIEFEDGGR